jgi:hypothetical protein
MGKECALKSCFAIIQAYTHSYLSSLQGGYEAAVQLAVADTNMPGSTFPTTFEQTGWSWEQVLDMEYLPE